MKTAMLGAAVGLGVLVAGCTFPSSGTVVSRRTAGQVQRIEYGVVEKVSPVVIEGQRGQIGTVGGGLVGAAAASDVGHGAGTALAQAGGAVVGAVAGQAVEEAMTRKNALELLIKLDAGSMIVVTQSDGPAFGVGERVAVASGAGGARVIAP